MRLNASLCLLALASCHHDASAPGAPEDASTDASAADASATSLDCSDDGGEWASFGQNVCNTRFQKSSGTLAKDTASRLATKWTYAASGDVSATPAVASGSVFVPDWGGTLARLDAKTGQPVWTKSIAAALGFVDDAGTPVSGFVSRTTPIVTPDMVIFGTQRSIPQLLSDPRPNAFVVAVDPASGATKWVRALHEGHPAAVITASPVLDGGRVYVGVSSLEEAFASLPGYTCCTFRGSVAALDAATGALVWQTHTIEDAAYFGADGKTPSGLSGVAVWSSHGAVDRKRRSIYITTGNNYSAPPGATDVVPGNHVGAILALDLDTGAIRWSRELAGLDVFNFSSGASHGRDYDFGAGANLFSVVIDGVARELVGAGQKSGVYTALDPDSGAIVWQTQVGPGGHFGGIHWGTATDGQRIYVGVNNEKGVDYKLAGSGAHAGETTQSGAWSALDPATGTILWQVPNPALNAPNNGASVNGPLTVVNGVVLAGSMDDAGTMYALDAVTGDVLWSFASGGTVYGGAAVVDGVVYWGAGYPSRLGFGTSSKKVYAFEVR